MKNQQQKNNENFFFSLDWFQTIQVLFYFKLLYLIFVLKLIAFELSFEFVKNKNCNQHIKKGLLLSFFFYYSFLFLFLF